MQRRERIIFGSGLATGIKEGLVIPRGCTFTLKGLLPEKGPYSWFSRYFSTMEPAPNWEYFVQAGEFVRLSHIAAAQGFRVTFEDDWMDLGLYDGNRLIVCCEIKERASQMQGLVRGIKKYEGRLNLTAHDRGNDALRKAKYIAKRRPEYFTLVAIGARLEYRVSYPAGRPFELSRGVIPWV